jgi:hypothetical protein
LQEFSARFKKFYNSIPIEVKPPPRVSQLRYTDSFDSDFTLLLRERRYNTLGAMMSDTIEVEVNIMDLGKIKHNFDRNGKNPQGDVQPSTSQSLDKKIDLMMKTMERLMENMYVESNPTPREKNDIQPRNQNFRRAPTPHIRKRDQRDEGDQQIRTHFQNNYEKKYFDQIIQVIQVDIGGHPHSPNGSKQFSGHFGNLLFLAGFHFQGHFEGLNEVFLRSRFSMIAEGILIPQN